MISDMKNKIETFLYVAVILWFAHCIGDFALQADFLAAFKKNYCFMCFIHSFICAGMLMCSFMFIIWTDLLDGVHKVKKVKLYRMLFFLFFFFLFSHCAIDQMKAGGLFNMLLGKDPSNLCCQMTGALWIDQALHFVSIMLGYYLFSLRLTRCNR